MNGTRFRIWANNILKQYLIKGYAIDKRRLNHYDELKDIVRLMSRAITIRDKVSDGEYSGLFNVMSMMKIRWLFWLLILLLSSCQNRNKANDEVSVEEYAEEIKEAEEGQLIHAPMSYFDFDKVDNLVSFFDSISQKHHIPKWRFRICNLSSIQF